MINWAKDEDKRKLVKAYLENGFTYPQIAEKFNCSYDAIEKVVRRYRLRDGLEHGLLIKKNKNKLNKSDITKLARLIGEKIYENYTVIKLKEPKSKVGKGKKVETSVLDISDAHIGMINEVLDNKEGKKVVTYNNDIFVKELEILQNSVGDIHDILSKSYRLEDLVIHCLGDMITNDRIFPEQTFEIEKVVGLQVWDAINYLTLFINNMLKIYKNVKFVGVVGNHGRSNPTHYNEPVENNFEYFVYKTLEKQFAKSKRVEIVVPTSRRYIHTINGWKHLIEHGDSLRGSSDTAIEKQIKEISLNVGGFDMMHYGHFHKLKEREISDKVIVKQNGCWIEKDSYGWNKFKQYSVPKQHFFGCNKKRPQTWMYQIDLRG